MFRINKLTDYAVVLLVDMARTKRVRAAQQIAAETGVPLPTVSKVMKALVRGSLVTSTRGAAGGYELARSADRITVADMIQALEGPIALTSCVDTTEDLCGLEELCPMHGHWNSVNRKVEDALRTVTLGDMAQSLPGSEDGARFGRRDGEDNALNQTKGAPATGATRAGQPIPA